MVQDAAKKPPPTAAHETAAWCVKFQFDYSRAGSSHNSSSHESAALKLKPTEDVAPAVTATAGEVIDPSTNSTPPCELSTPLIPGLTLSANLKPFEAQVLANPQTLENITLEDIMNRGDGAEIYHFTMTVPALEDDKTLHRVRDT
jgi:hypothetical protein